MGPPPPHPWLFLSEIFICDSNKNYIENWLETNLERDTLNTHSLVWNKYNKKQFFIAIKKKDKEKIGQSLFKNENEMWFNILNIILWQCVKWQFLRLRGL